MADLTGKGVDRTGSPLQAFTEVRILFPNVDYWADAEAFNLEFKIALAGIAGGGTTSGDTAITQVRDRDLKG
eukprot:5268607-Pyramimonas_sp.AAC.1